MISCVNGQTSNLIGGSHFLEFFILLPQKYGARKFQWGVALAHGKRIGSMQRNIIETSVKTFSVDLGMTLSKIRETSAVHMRQGRGRGACNNNNLHA